MSLEKVIEEGIEYSDLDSQDKDTLRYLESCMVDKKGKLDPEKMNFHDFKSIDYFAMAEIVEIEERDSSGEIKITKFSDKAWELAMKCRKDQAESWIEHEVEEFEGVDENGD